LFYGSKNEKIAADEEFAVVLPQDARIMGMTQWTLYFDNVEPECFYA